MEVAKPKTQMKENTTLVLFDSLANSQWVYLDTREHVGDREKGKYLSFLKIDLLSLSNRCLILGGGIIPAYGEGPDGVEEQPPVLVILICV